MDTLSRSKSMAKALRKALADRNVDLSHSDCLGIVARQFGFTDWNTLKAASDREAAITITVFIEHGRQSEAVDFYRAAFGADLLRRYIHDDMLIAVELRIGETLISVSGSNPRRELEPERGGPFYPKANGAVSTVLGLEVGDLDTALRRAVDAGAVIRDKPEIATDGRRAAAFFDPFGHI
ncbi:glyoxalase superfamily protein, partial [Rhizobiaceae sp. 2RAB30]